MIEASNVRELIDRTGGTPSQSLDLIEAPAAYFRGDMVRVKNSLASLAAQVNKLLTIVQEIQAGK